MSDKEDTSMTAAPAWPDETRPGVPLNPERESRYWMQRNGVTFVAEWRPHRAMWLIGGRYETASQVVNSECALLGPALLPAEVEARVAAAVAKEREACAQEAEWRQYDSPEEIAAAIRARGGSDG